MSQFTRETISTIKKITFCREKNLLFIDLFDRAKVSWCLHMSVELISNNESIYNEPIVTTFIGGGNSEFSNVHVDKIEDAQKQKRIVLKLPFPIPICIAHFFITEDSLEGKMRRQRSFPLA